MPLWTVIVVAGLFAVLCLLAYNRAGHEGMIGALARLMLMVIGAGVAWFAIDVSSQGELATERRALVMRAQELLARATMPGSPLACLDGNAGDIVENSCEKALFASPEITAAAVSYVSAQVALFADMTEYAARTGKPLSRFSSLRRALEADRFGIVARVLAVRDGCLSGRCPVLAALRLDPVRVNANLSEGAYELYVARHAASWPPAGDKSPVAGIFPEGTPPHTASAGHPIGDDVFLPSADSIPPVNIMNSEPPPQQETTGAAGPRAKPAPTPPRRRSPAAASTPPVDLNAAAAARSKAGAASAQ
jgi:hypothetical protein